VIDLWIRQQKNFSKIWFPIPRHLSLPLWERCNFPAIDLFAGRADIFHALGDDCPPIRHAEYILTLHGISYLVRPDLLDATFVRKRQSWLKTMIRRADYFISVSENMRREFLERFAFIDPKRIAVIPLGIGREFKILEKEKVKTDLVRLFAITRPYILYVGGIQPHKNIEGIVRGYSLLADQYPEVDLVLVGSEHGGPEGILNLITDLKLGHRIKIMKYLSQESDELPILYNGAECFVFPSFTEGWASPPLEAMACGTPVVTSNVSSLPESVGNAAILVDPNNIEEISQAICRLLLDTDLKKTMVQRGVIHAAKFPWKRCAEKTYDFYRDIATR
jgi:glycosyltransferase involved in cell wall biosynthesis